MLPVILTLCTLAQAPADTPANKTLQGEWVGGKEDLEIHLIVGPGNRIAIMVGKDSAEGTFKLDATKSPAHIDIDWGQPGKVSTIYEITDNGKKLRMQNNKPGNPRPAGLTAEAVEMKRLEKKE